MRRCVVYEFGVCDVADLDVYGVTAVFSDFDNCVLDQCLCIKETSIE